MHRAHLAMAMNGVLLLLGCQQPQQSMTTSAQRTTASNYTRSGRIVGDAYHAWIPARSMDGRVSYDTTESVIIGGEFVVVIGKGLDYSNWSACAGAIVDGSCESASVRTAAMPIGLHKGWIITGEGPEVQTENIMAWIPEAVKGKLVHASTSDSASSQFVVRTTGTGATQRYFVYRLAGGDRDIRVELLDCETETGCYEYIPADADEDVFLEIYPEGSGYVFSALRECNEWKDYPDDGHYEFIQHVKEQWHRISSQNLMACEEPEE